MSQNEIILDDFFPEVRLDAPEVGLPIVRQAVRDAAREFCKRTHIWQETKTRSIDADKREYLVPLPEDTILQDITYFARRIENTGLIFGGTRDPVKYADRTRNKLTEADLDHMSPGWRDFADGNAGFTNWGITPDRKHYFLMQIPEIDYQDGIRFTMILAPNQLNNALPEILFDEYASEIGAGAAERLLKIPGKPWTDMNAAVMRKREFSRGVVNALRKTQSQQPRLKFRRLGS